jgi:hypothetical protein
MVVRRITVTPLSRQWLEIGPKIAGDKSLGDAQQ